MKGQRIVHERVIWVISEVKETTFIIKTLNITNQRIKEIVQWKWLIYSGMGLSVKL